MELTDAGGVHEVPLVSVTTVYPGASVPDATAFEKPKLYPVTNPVPDTEPAEAIG